jgi:hypothetical protein
MAPMLSQAINLIPESVLEQHVQSARAMLESPEAWEAVRVSLLAGMDRVEAGGDLFAQEGGGSAV